MSFASRLISGVRQAGVTLLDLTLPTRCLVCQTPVMAPGGLCAACWRHLTFVEAGGPEPRRLAAEARVNHPAIADVSAAVVLDAASRPVVHALKYRDRHEAAGVMALQIASAARIALSGSNLIVCVPMHRLKLWQRRFNQAALIAQRVSAVSGVPCRLDALVKLRASRPQVGLHADERRANVAGAFAIHPAAAGAVYGRNVLLIDDVLTTGATAGACAETLLRSGAACVHVAVYALAPLAEPPI
jgi:ComF family protein